MDWLTKNRLNLCHVFTVDDLFHLHRGGRVSKMTAVLGTMINIKPLLHVDDEGHLIAVGQGSGRKRSLMKLVDMMEERVKDYRGKIRVFFISHGDCLEEARYVADLVKERFGIEEVLIHPVGATIGAHSGAGNHGVVLLGKLSIKGGRCVTAASFMQYSPAIQKYSPSLPSGSQLVKDLRVGAGCAVQKDDGSRMDPA